MESHVNGLDIQVLKQTAAAVQADPALGKCRFRAVNRWTYGSRNVGKVSTFHAAKEELQHKETFFTYADEPPLLAGEDSAPNPVEHLLTALAACVTTSIVAHAAVRGIHIEELESTIEGDVDLAGFLGLNDDVPKGYQQIRMRFAIKSDADEEVLRSLAAYSPVLNTITSGAPVMIAIDRRPIEKTAELPQPEANP